MIKGQVCRRVCWTGKVWEFQSIQGFFSIFELVFYRTWHDSKLRIKGQVCRSWGVCSTERVGIPIHTGGLQCLRACLFHLGYRTWHNHRACFCFFWVIEHSTLLFKLRIKGQVCSESMQLNSKECENSNP